MKNIKAIVTTMLITLVITTGVFISNPRTVPAPVPTQESGEVLASTAQLQILRRINKSRATRGLRTLKLSAPLSRSARAKCSNMIKYNYWAHNNPNGTKWYHFTKKYAPNYNYVGEILAKSWGNNFVGRHNAWMASTSHKSVIVSKKFTNYGISTCHYSNGKDLVVVHFGRK